MDDCGDCELGDCCGDCELGDCCGDCDLGDCCGDTDCCCCCFYSTNHSTSSHSRRSRSTGASCCCRFAAAVTIIAVATLAAILLVSYAVAFPARVTVEDAYLRRFALTTNANGTAALAYDVSLAVAVRNRNFASAGGVWRTAPLDAELRFDGQTFARASARLESADWGIFRSRGKGVYRVTMSSAAAADKGGVVLGGDAVAEFMRESVAGVFELELAVAGGGGEGHHQGVKATCPLKLSVPTASGVVAFTTVKCT